MQSVFSPNSAFYPASIVAIDFNNDKQLDLALTSFASDSVILLFGKGDGNFENYTTYPTDGSSSADSVGIGYFDNDNRDRYRCCSF